MLQTADDPPAFIIVRTKGWLTGSKDVLDKVKDPKFADPVNPNSYKYRVNLTMETGDDRYAFLNTLMWIASGCRRNHEGISPSLTLQSNLHEVKQSRLMMNSYIRFIPRELVSTAALPVQYVFSCMCVCACVTVFERAILDGENWVSSTLFCCLFFYTIYF